MKVLLTTLNSKYTHTSIALYYLKNKIDDVADVSVLNLNVNENLSNCLNKILSYTPDVIGFGVYIWNVEETLKLACDIKKINPNIIIAFGGPEVSYNPEELLSKYDYIDSILCGESERNIVEFIQDAKNENIQRIYKLPVEASDIPSISEDIADNYDKRVVYFETSRGCPFRCSYCMSCIDKTVRYFDLDQVKADLKHLLDLNVIQIRFIDRTFNSDRKRAIEIWQFLLNNGKDTEFHFEICASLIDDETLEFLKSVPKDTFRFEIGVQSTHKETLEEINRRYNFEYEKEVMKKLMNMQNIHIHADLIIGLPHETTDIFKKSFNDLYELYPHEMQLGFLKMLKGTDIYDRKDEFEYVYSNYPPYEVLKNKFMTYEEIAYLKKFETVFDYIYNSKKFLVSIRYMETKFDSYYEMYEYITNYFIENKLIDIKLSYDTIYMHLIKMFNDDGILIQTLTYDYVDNFKIIREWMYSKYDIKKEISAYIRECDELSKLSTNEVSKRYKFIALDYNVDSMKREKTIYKFEK
ncbi:MAG: B12-binding domain-containing radical SAM protein [Oscillospiraceae bacterium]|nr:B12-binding domain-containing radical SAM protein [Oscillospiraceae bacterium]